MRPSKRLLYLLLALFLFGIVASFLDSVIQVFLGLSGILLVVSLIDALTLLAKDRLELRRRYPQKVALDVETSFECELINLNRWTSTWRFYEGMPDHTLYEGFPHEVKLKPQEKEQFNFPATFHRRGETTIQAAYCETSSWMRLWWKQHRLAETTSVKVYPNYQPALEYGLWCLADRVQQMGIVKPKQKGQSKEFHQLRDYQEGDSIRAIDWKATSKRNRLISREYQEEKDQTLILAVDTSSRVRALDGELPVLDHLLNATILIAYMALQQGDKVGIMTFGGEKRFLTPVKGKQNLSKILNHIYNYEASSNFGDYHEFVEQVRLNQKKRATLILLTNLRAEDQYESVPALQQIAKKHQLLVASIKEQALEDLLHQPVEQTREKPSYLGANADDQDTND